MSTSVRASASCWWAVICLLLLVVGCVLSMPAQEDTRADKPLGGVPDAGSVHEEVVVAAALYVRKKDPITLRRQKREIRNNHVTVQHGTSHTNRFDGAGTGKREPFLGKQHEKVLTNWKNDNGAASSKVGLRKE